jgi:hypothetical protein
MGASEKVYKLCLHNLYTFERAPAGRASGGQVRSVKHIYIFFTFERADACFLASGGKLVDEPALAS